MIKWKLKTASVNPDQNPNLEKKNEGVSGGIHGYCVQDIQEIMEYGFLKVVVVFQRIFTVCCGLWIMNSAFNIS